MIPFRWLLVLAGLLLAACGAPAPASLTAERPHSVARLESKGRVADAADLFTSAQEATLGERLAALEAQTTDQLVIVTIPSLDGASIEQVGRELGNRWGIGRADLDNGVLLIVAPTEQRVRIAVGEGLEQVLTDARAAEIVALMLPHFRAGDHFTGVDRGSQEIVRILATSPRRRGGHG